jgi:hypothetical protein
MCRCDTHHILQAAVRYGTEPAYIRPAGLVYLLLFMSRPKSPENLNTKYLADTF